MDAYYTLANGVKIPQIAYGTWRLEDTPETTDLVKRAIHTGYNHIDTAAKYGNEASVGMAVRTCGVRREDLFVTSKLRNTMRGYENAIADCERALRAMGLDYFDLYLIHWPAGAGYYPDWEQINAETWRGLETLYQSGKVRAIGISNFWPHHIQSLMRQADTAPMVCQIKLHPGFVQPEQVAYCQYNNMLVEAYSPLGAGQLLRSDILGEMAARYDRTPAQICVRFCLQLGTLPIPKSANAVRMAQNLEVYDFTIQGEDMQTLRYMETGLGNEIRDPDTLNLD